MSISNPSVVSTSRIDQFWQNIPFELTDLKNTSERHHELPMARIKKIMKMDDSVQQCVRIGKTDNLDDWFGSACYCGQGL